MTTETAPSIEELRREYAALRRNARTFATDQDWTGAVSRIAYRLADGEDPTPMQWVIAARQATTVCDRCQGTGEYGWGAVVNGKVTHRGTCYHCEGSGRMNQDDYRRCYGHLMHQIRQAVA